MYFLGRSGNVSTSVAYLARPWPQEGKILEFIIMHVVWRARFDLGTPGITPPPPKKEVKQRST